MKFLLKHRIGCLSLYDGIWIILCTTLILHFIETRDFLALILFIPFIVPSAITSVELENVFEANV